MYLVHVHLRPPRSGARLPDPAAAAIARCAAGRDGFVHVSVHPDPEASPVVGLYLSAPSLDAAEAAARRLWRHVGSQLAALGEWEVERAEVPLLPGVDPSGTF
ncbi:hypothetical protein [Streptomyces sp. NPDC091371]|uniref:hypothetical protein n=1 Tax=Streptomyces sp. NPDC091371 TaxID=3155303 RepID=UPI0034268AC8